MENEQRVFSPWSTTVIYRRFSVQLVALFYSPGTHLKIHLRRVFMGTSKRPPCDKGLAAAYFRHNHFQNFLSVLETYKRVFYLHS